MATSKYRWPMAKSVNVIRSDPNRANVKLTLKANVHSWMEVLPSWSANLTADLGQDAEKILYLRNPDKDVPLPQPTAESSTDRVTATVEKIPADSEEAAKGDYRLVVKLSPEARTPCSFWIDAAKPAFLGDTAYYLVRAIAPTLGSWGQTSAEVERVLACP